MAGSGEIKINGQSLVCYCFGYTEEEIKQDFLGNGQSLIMARIMREKKNGACDCGARNPKGR